MRVKFTGSCGSSNVLRNIWEWTSLVLPRQATMLEVCFTTTDVCELMKVFMRIKA